MFGSYKIAIYTFLLSAVLPVRVRHVENARTWLPTLIYAVLRRISFREIAFVNFTRVFHSHSRLQRFSDLQSENRK